MAATNGYMTGIMMAVTGAFAMMFVKISVTKTMMTQNIVAPVPASIGENRPSNVSVNPVPALARAVPV